VIKASWNGGNDENLVLSCLCHIYDEKNELVRVGLSDRGRQSLYLLGLTRRSRFMAQWRGTRSLDDLSELPPWIRRAQNRRRIRPWAGLCGPRILLPLPDGRVA